MSSALQTGLQLTTDGPARETVCFLLCTIHLKYCSVSSVSVCVALYLSNCGDRNLTRNVDTVFPLRFQVTRAVPRVGLWLLIGLALVIANSNRPSLNEAKLHKTS